MSRRGRQAGFTLVELLISLVISAIVIAGALALLSSQQHTFQRSSSERAVQENARVALGELTANLRLVGYGIEPALAFDFGAIPNLLLDRLPPGTAASVAGFSCAAAVTCRDSAGGPDELVFHYRNPSFVRPLASAPGAGSITMWGPLNQPLHAGQILQVACYSGSMYWAFVTVGAEVPADRSAVTVDVPLLGDAAGAFGRQNAVMGDPCFSTVAPPGSPTAVVTPATKVFMVERFRYFIQSYDGAGNVVPWRTAGSRPYLMLDKGLADANGAPLLQMVAPDVEDLQVSYVFPRSGVGLAPVVGATAGTALTATAAGIDLTPAAAPPPQYADPATAASRATHFPANIGAVRVSIVVRSAEPDVKIADPATVPAAGNRPDVAGPQHYRRTRFDTGAATPNLDVRAPFFPSYSTDPADHLNVGGG